MKFCNVEIPGRLFELTRERIRSLTQFTIDDVRTPILSTGRAELAACNGLEQNWPLIVNRVLRVVLGSMEDAGDVAHIRRGVWARMRSLTDVEAAVICTIHQEPGYRFLGPELRVARRLAAAGYLRERVNKRFEVTAAGAMAYKKHTHRKISISGQ